VKRTNPHGRTPLLGDGGKPAAEQPAPAVEPRQRPTPKAAKPPVPYSHGRRDWDALNAIGQARAVGGHPIPGWQLTMRAGCVRCMARPGILPADHERARGMMLEWGWRWGGGMWLCGRCVDERERE
jgi:hypothetical protein